MDLPDVVRRAWQQVTEKGRVDQEFGLVPTEAPMNDMHPREPPRTRHGKNVHFNLNLHVNTTNICVLACRFCAFRKGPKHEDAYAPWGAIPGRGHWHLPLTRSTP